MTRFQNYTAMLLAACLFTVGCNSIPKRNQEPESLRQPKSMSVAQSQMIGSGVAHPQPNANQSNFAPQSPRQATIQRVQYPETSQQTGAPQTGVSQAGFFAPAQANGCGPDGQCVTQQPGPIRRALGSVGCLACPDGQCGSSDCPMPAPHGYVEFAPQGWNLYGVDPQEFICDGGDNAPRAHLLKDDTIDGLQPEDTVVHYTTDAGDIKFQPSNRVCVYSPRFAAIRKITSAVAGEKVLGLSQVDLPTGPSRVEMDLPGLVVADSMELGRANVTRHVDGLRDLNRGVRVEGDLAAIEQASILEAMSALTALETGQLADEQLALIQQGANAAIAWTIGESVEVAIEDLRTPTLTKDDKVEGFTVYDFPDAGRLRIIKMADKQYAQSGEEIGFAIRVQNVGDSAVRNVVITDNLVTRLVYVEDSQKSDIKSEFSTEANAGQSLRLEWKLLDELKVGDSALIEFRCKLR